MSSEFIIIREYSSYSNIDPDFIFLLGEEGLIEINFIEDEPSISISQLELLERYARWHYDLSVNVEGIDIIQNLLDKMNEMRDEINYLKQMSRIIPK